MVQPTSRPGRVEQMNVIQQVVEVKCPGLINVDDEIYHTFKCCQGTGLRWPGLSRECDGSHNTNLIQTCECGMNTDESPGRVPDVTLEKVIDLLELAAPPGRHTIYFEWEHKINGIRDDKWALCAIQHIRTNIDAFRPGVGPIRLEAACAALLATVDIGAAN